jgi:hypothetical protein
MEAGRDMCIGDYARPLLSLVYMLGGGMPLMNEGISQSSKMTKGSIVVGTLYLTSFVNYCIRFMISRFNNYGCE